MTLSINLITGLNKIAESVSNKEQLKREDEDAIKEIFNNILESENAFKINEIEEWFSTVSLDGKLVDRIVNIAHYLQAKHDANNKLKFASDSCSCGNS